MDPAAELAAALRPIRLPVPTEAEALADGLLAFALGLAVALAIYGLLRLALGLRRAPGAALRAELAASRRLDPEARLLAQARVAAQIPRAEAMRATLGAALYRPAGTVDLDATERALVRSSRRAGR